MSHRRAVIGAVAAVAAQRLCELVWSRRNERRLRARGAHEVGAGHYPVMVALHLGWLAVTAVEAIRSPAPPSPAVRRTLVVAVAAAQLLRYCAIAALGDRWTTRVLVLPGEPLVRRGPYRVLAHPNYVAVVVELAAIPAALGARRTAVALSAANAALLTHRIGVESAALNGPSGPVPAPDA